MTERKGRRSCLGCGCQLMGGLALVMVILIGWLIAVQGGVLERLGLRESPAEELLSGTPDRQAAEALREELHRADLNTRGVSFYVLPIAGTDGSLAIAVIDRSQGFEFGQTAEPREVLRRLQNVATGDTLERLGIRRVAVEIRNPMGETALVVTAESSDIKAFANGEMDRKEFVRAVDGRANLIRVMRGVREVLP